MPDIQTRKEVRLPAQRAAVTPRSYDADAHTVELVAATGYKVRRFDWSEGTYYLEQLSMESAAVDLQRVEKGVCPLLDTHGQWSLSDHIGIVESGRMEREGLVLVVRFADTDDARSVEARVADGTLRAVSVGYTRLEILKETRTDGQTPTYTVTRWALNEVSFVPVPADPDAGVRSEEDGLHPCIIMETRNMPDKKTAAEPANPAEDAARNDAPANTPAPAADTSAARTEAAPAPARMSATEVLDFAEDARSFGVTDPTQIRTWADTMTPDAARSALIRHVRDKQNGDVKLTPANSAARVTVDERDTARTAIGNALLHRFDPASNELSDAGREYRGMSLLEIARSNLDRNGERTKGLSKRELADLALRTHSTSDFPYALSNVAGKTLRAGYEAAPQTFKRWQRRATISDFKQVSRLQIGAMPSFLLVPEGGEFKMGSIAEGREVYALATYGRKFAITRQVLINDDLDAFSRIPSMFGAAAARFESDAAYAPLIANPNMADGTALFHADHGNLAGSGAVPSELTLAAAEVAMGNQTGLQSEVLNLEPKYLLVGRKDSVAARKMLSAITAGTTGDVNVFANTLELVVESRLNRASGATPWFTAADPSQIDTIEYAYLEGDEGVFLDERVGFDVDGIEYKARLDFAAKAIDHRGLYMNPGA